MAKTVAVSSGDFTHVEVKNADGEIEEKTFGKGEKTEVRERSYELIADNTNDSSRIEVKSETAYVKAMAVKDGATVMGGGSHVIAEASHNRATGSVSGDNAKMAIQTENAVTSFKSNCPNARCTVTVTETKSLKDSVLSKWHSFWGSNDQKQPEIEDNASSSKGEKRKQKSSKDHDKSHN